MSGYSTTPNYGLLKPIVGADNDQWGSHWNLNADTLDAQLKAVDTAKLPLAGGTMSGPLIDAGGTSYSISPATTPLYAWTDAAGSVAAGILPDGTFRLGKLSFVISDGGRFTGPTTDAGSTVTGAPEARALATFQYAWGDPSGNVAAMLLSDGTLRVGSLNATTLNATSFTSSQTVFAQLTIGSDVWQPLISTAAGKYALADPSGNVALLLDNNGFLRAKTLGGNSLDQMATLPKTQHVPQLRLCLDPVLHRHARLSTNAEPDMAYHHGAGRRLRRSAAGLPERRHQRQLHHHQGGPRRFSLAERQHQPDRWHRSGKPMGAGQIQQRGRCQVLLGADPDTQPAPAAVTTITLANSDPSSTIIPPGTGGDGLAAGEKAVSFSDWMPISSLKRTDAGGVFPLLMIRHFCGTGTPRLLASGSAGANFDAASNGRTVRSYVNAGDCVTTPASFTSTTLSNDCMIVAVQVLTRARTVTIMAIGDSLSQGVGTTTGSMSFVRVASQQISTPALPWQVVSSAYSGMVPFDFYFNGHALLDAVRPNVAVIQISGRGGPTYSTATDALTCWSRALEDGAAGAQPGRRADPLCAVARQRRDGSDRREPAAGQQSRAASPQPGNPSAGRQRAARSAGHTHDNQSDLQRRRRSSQRRGTSGVGFGACADAQTDVRDILMATLVTLANANFAANAVGFVPPVIPGLQTWAYFGNAAGDNVNLASGGPAISNIGTGPVYSPGYGRFTQLNGALDTNVVDGPSFVPATLLFVSRLSGSGSPYNFGTFAAAKGVYSWMTSVNLRGYGQGASQTDLAIASTTFRLYAITFASLNNRSVSYDLTSATSANAGALSSAYTPNTGAHLLIGMDNSGSSGQFTDIAFFAAYTNNQLTLAQLNSLVPSIRATLATRGITV